jgi:hypothetical protein
MGATPALAGSDFLLTGTTPSYTAWYGRVSAAGRAAVETTFKSDVGGSEMYDVIPFGDGALLVGVHNPVTPGESNGWIIAVDAAAKTRWAHRLGKGSYHAFTRVATDRRGHVLAAGAKKLAAYQGWIVDVDKEGKVAGEQLVESKTWDVLMGIAVGGDEEIYTTAKAAPHQDADGVAVLTRRKSLATETWRHQILADVVAVSPPIVHRASVEFLAVVGKGPGGTLHLVRAPRDGKKPAIVPVGGETFALDWNSLPAWIVGTTDADTTIGQVRRAADGGVEWRTIKIARPR